jgi:simple sugar transport system permease protein
VTEKASAPAPGSEAEVVPSVAARLALYQRAGGLLTPLLTAVFAFFVAGLVVLFTVGDWKHFWRDWRLPLDTYNSILEGTGLTWLSPVTMHAHLYLHALPYVDQVHWRGWDTGSTAALNLQQTLLNTAPLILTGLAVAFAFRCGLFNIGGNGQYTVGSIVAVQFGIWFAGMPTPAHIVLAMVAASLAGAVWAGIAGILRATVGAHEVITTIMLNWIALWAASYLVGFNGPLQTKVPGLESVPVTATIADSAKLPVFWGDPLLQGLHIGLFIAIGALVVYSVLLNRTTLGYEVRAVGFNSEAARYGGISVARNYFLAMAISGAFAGLAGAIDLLGWEFQLDLTVVQTTQIGFIGIAVALLGRNSPVGIFFSALLFGALLVGTSTRNTALQEMIRPELAGNLTRIIQGVVVLFVGADLLVLYLWNARRKVGLGRSKVTEA